MSDFKSKLPDMKELTGIASKLFKDIKGSVNEIIDEYKKKRTRPEDNEVGKENKPADENSSADTVDVLKEKASMEKKKVAAAKKAIKDEDAKN